MAEDVDILKVGSINGEEETMDKMLYDRAQCMVVKWPVILIFKFFVWLEIGYLILNKKRLMKVLE